MKGTAVDIRDQELKELKKWETDTIFILRQNFQRIDELERRINMLSKTNTWQIVFNWIIIACLWVIMAIVFWK